MKNFSDIAKDSLDNDKILEDETKIEEYISYMLRNGQQSFNEDDFNYPTIAVNKIRAYINNGNFHGQRVDGAGNWTIWIQ